MMRNIPMRQHPTLVLDSHIANTKWTSPLVPFSHFGFCPICERSVVFEVRQEWLRDNYICSECGSIPRERVLMRVINDLYPKWRDLRIHESSPSHRGTSAKLQSECSEYIPTQYYPEIPPGAMHNGFRREDLEQLSFADESVDLHITQDVLEHIFNPEKAFQEISRTLRPGGAHIFTVPLVAGYNPSFRRATLLPDGTVENHAEAVFHGNPVDNTGFLVTFDYGYDFVDMMNSLPGISIFVIQIDDLRNGIRAELNEVIVMRKLHKKSYHYG